MIAPHRPGPRFSVVIPAHDEERVVARCLQAFVADLAAGEAEVVVVANGCTDRTAAVARDFAGVRVVELAEASKTAALDAGDAAVTAFPRIYLDADITVSAAAMRAVVESLRRPGVHAAAPTASFELEGRPVVVRSFYRAHRAMPYLSDALVGTGFYALSAVGRARFDRFPRLTADDLFVQRLFSRDERHVVAGETFTVQTPHDLHSLVAVRTRVAHGNAELATGSSTDPTVASSTGGSVRALLSMAARHPRRSPDVVVYVAVTAAARARARRSARSGRPAWERDDSSR